MKFNFFFVICFFLFSALPLSAVELHLDSPEDEVIEENNTFTEDYLFAGSSLSFGGEVNDLYVAADDFDFYGKTKLAIIAIADQINIAGKVGNGVKAAAQFITLRGDMIGTNFLAAEVITFGEESQVQGTTFAAARKIQVKGSMIGDFYGAAGEIIIQNEIQGDVHVYTGQLKISEGGKIVGNLIYNADQELTEAELGRVTGQVTFEVSEESKVKQSFLEHFWEELPRYSMFFKLSFLVLGLLSLFFPFTRILEKPRTHQTILNHSLWGLLPIFVYPTAIVLFIVLVITIPLSMVLLLGLIPLWVATKIIGLTLIGGWIANATNLKKKNRFIFFLIAAILYSLLTYIPFVGFLLMIFVSAIGWGMLISVIFQKKVA